MKFILELDKLSFKTPIRKKLDEEDGKNWRVRLRGLIQIFN